MTQWGYGGPHHYSAPPPPQSQEMNTFATLSVIFAFIFAPAGAIFGHLGLTQIQRTGQPGRTRAIIGLTLSYTIIVVFIVALVVWLVLRGDADTPPLATSTPGPHTSATVSPTAPTAATSEDVFALSCGEGAGPRAEWPGRTVSDAELGSIPMDLTDIKSALKSDVSVDRLAADPPRTDLLRPPYPDGTVEPAACTSMVFAGTADAYRDIGYRAVYLTRISAPAPEYVSVIQVASSYPDSAAALRALEKLTMHLVEARGPTIKVTRTSGETITLERPLVSETKFVYVLANQAGEIKSRFDRVLFQRGNVVFDLSLQSRSSVSEITSMAVSISHRLG